MELIIFDRIRNRALTFFDEFVVEMKYDSIASTFRFSFLFNPLNPEHKEFACVSHFHIATLKHEGEVILTGYILSQHFDDEPEKQMVHISGYSLPGVLEDCEIYPSPPVSLKDIAFSWSPDLDVKYGGGYPLQSDGLSLREIAQKYLSPFGIKMVVDSSVSDSMDEKYDETTAKATQSLKSYLCELASQRNIVITHDEFGRLVFTRPSSTRTPIAHFERGSSLFTKMSLVFDGKNMHSNIMVLQQQDEDPEIPSNENETINPYVPFVFRPRVIVQNSGDANETSNTGKNIRADELRNMKLTIDIAKWEIGKKIIRPGNIITVTNPYVYLYKKSKWFVESVTLKGNPKSLTAAMECVIPECYTGEEPVYIFKGINLH